MAKPTIAVDIDDVLAAQAEGFVQFSNERFGTKLLPSDYQEHWGEMWQVGLEEVERRSLEMHDSNVQATYRHDDKALPVLQKLRQDYRLIIVTSRRLINKQLTLDWLDLHYGNIFDEIVFAGIFDNGPKDAAFVGTKTDHYQLHGAQYVIDDQLKHCLAAAGLGIETLLFGDYTWNQTAEKLPAHITRVHDWAAVEKYFDGRTAES